MGSTLLAVIFPGLCTVLVAIIEVRGAKYRKKALEVHNRLHDEACARKEADILAMRMMDASVELGYVTSIAVSGGHINGNVEAAQEKARKAQEAYETFLRNRLLKV